MKPIFGCRLMLAVMLTFTQQVGFAGSTENYLAVDELFITIEDANRQAEAWGTCAATYQLMSALADDSPAQHRYIKNMANGAQIATMMTHVMTAFDGSADEAARKFASTWNYAKSFGVSIVEIQSNRLLTDAELLGESRAGEFQDKLFSTFEQCLKNGEGQQYYIDTWREMAKNGLVQQPSE